jgi:hypothetical protein
MMAAKTLKKKPAADATPAPRFYEIVIQGPFDLTHGFLTGLIMGSGHKAIYINGPEEGISGPTLASRAKEMLHLLPHEHHIIVDHVTRGLLKKGQKTMLEQTGLVLLSERRVLKGHFRFSYIAWASAYNKQITAMLKTLPAGLKLVNFESKEKVDKTAKGAEGYAPLHDYEVSGSGEIRGRIDHLIAARNIVDAHPLVDVDDIHLDLAK